MKVLQNKMLILVISSILFPALVVMAISFSNYGHIVENNSGQIMQLMCSEKRQVIDEKLLNIEQSVHTIYHFATEQHSVTDNLWQDEEQFFEHISRMRELMETTVKYTDGAVSVYYRLDSEIQGPKQGVWLVQDENGDYLEREITDISLYDEDDIEHVGWYYIPITNGKETWINPYYNKNMNEEIISYVIPIILNEKIIGVVGMDIATNLLYENTKNVTVYDRGYAFLMDNEGEFVYHPEMKGNTISEEFNMQHTYLYEKSLLSIENQSVETYRWNDTYGHEYGDKLIQSGAAILKKVWGSDSIYRVGGDEFVIVCSDMEKECAETRTSLFEEAIEDYNRQNNSEKKYLQMAIGMAVYSSETDKEYMDVFRRADSAMYEDKKQKKMKHSLGDL